MVRILEGEMFRAVPGYEGLYEVSNLSRVKSLERYRESPHGKRLIKEKIVATLSRQRAGFVWLHRDGKKKAFQVTELKKLAFDS